MVHPTMIQGRTQSHFFPFDTIMVRISIFPHEIDLLNDNCMNDMVIYALVPAQTDCVSSILSRLLIQELISLFCFKI